MTALWVAYEDMAAGEVVLEVDETSVRVFSSRAAEARSFHLSQLRVTPSGPDRKGRYQVELTSSANGAGRANLHTDAAGMTRIRHWLDAVDRARTALRPPLVHG